MDQQLTVIRRGRATQTGATMNPRAAPFIPPAPGQQLVLRPAQQLARPTTSFKHQFYLARSRYHVMQRIKDESNMSRGVFKVLQLATGKMVVEKRVGLEDQACKKRVRSEIRALYQLRYHGAPPYVNSIIEHFWYDDLEYVSIYLEYCDLGTVDDVQRHYARERAAIPESFAWHLLFGVANALAYCHDGILDAGTNPRRASPNQAKKWNVIIHNDIKPANIFLSSKIMYGEYPCVVLGDFGSAVRASDLEQGLEDPQYQIYGTPTWLAPETDAGMCFPDPTDYGTYSDIWSMGAVVHAICHQLAQPMQSLAARGHSCGPAYSPKLNELVTHCMAFDPKRRPAAGEVAVEARVGMQMRGEYYR